VTSLGRRRREVCSERDSRSSKTIRMASAGGGRLRGGSPEGDLTCGVAYAFGPGNPRGGAVADGER
jgi:hypothetical protein